MSTTDYRKPFHRRNDSGELDVFEAADYFSGYNDNYTLFGGANLTHKVVSKYNERRGFLRDGRRVSLDVPSLKHYYLHQGKHSAMLEAQQHQQHQQKPKEKKKYSQPSSPGGKIAQFLNSLFSQTNSKKKKTLKSLSSTQSMKDEDESSIGRRKRRSSISHFRSTSSAVDARSLSSNSSSGFRTPPPYNLNTATKSCKDFRGFNDCKDVLATLSKYRIQGNGNNINGNHKDEKAVNNFDWIDEKLRMVEKMKNNNNNHGHHDQEEKENYKKFGHQEECDGADSDSSSDLFELQIDCDFGFCSSGLPVYETTHMNSIKRSSSTAITNGPIKA